jgi:formamidopyrimidine-DNA glycosylase
LLFRSSTRSEYSLDQAIPPFNAPFPNKSTRVVVYFASGDVLYFNDIRTFGYMKLLPGELVHQDLFLSRLGVEPLEPTFTVAVLQKLLTCSPRQKIKYFLLDQTKIAGLGNIYTDEALFAAGILPTRLVSSLTEEEVESLYSAIIKVLSKGVLLRGSSKTSYVTLDGRAGGFLMENAVYARSGKACLVCGQTIQKTVVAGRGTHYCAYCQK